MITKMATFIFLVAMLNSSSVFAGRVISHGAKICNDSEFTCYKVKKGDTWQNLFTDETQRDLIMRINRMNIKLQPGMTIAIPKSDEKLLLDYSPFAQEIDPPGKKTIIVSISDLAFGAYNPDGTLEHWGPISAAKGYCPDTGKACRTATGKFSIYEKRGAGCFSTKFPIGRGGAPMPYCMFFHKGFALHGSYIVPGYNDSHGCVRLFVSDAKWLNQEFTQGAGGVTVIVNK